ncbi:MAG: DUF4129 domain-containing protein [Armatimonadia bacterium]|nr:DUF4129 domain-containing protein [Armatimonadia bacterium]
MRRLPRWLVSVVSATALTAWAVGSPPGRPSEAALRDTLSDILSSGYQLAEPPEAVLRDLLLRLLRGLRDFAGGVAEINPLGGIPGWARPLLTGALIVILGLIVAHLIYSLRGLMRERSGKPGRPERKLERLEPRTVRARAEDAVRRGEYEEAVRLLYLAVLLRLDRIGLLTHDPARTNWENLDAFTRADAPARDAMRQLTGAVDACVYGGRSASQQTWERTRAWAEQLWRAGEAS